MPENILPLLSAYLWDLRAQCESQIRALTDAQRRVDEYREASTPKGVAAARDRLQQNLAAIIKTNNDVREAVHAAAEQAARLPPTKVLVRRASDRERKP